VLLHVRGGYLYEHRPDIFPEGVLTQTEIALWDRHYQEMNNGKR